MVVDTRRRLEDLPRPSDDQRRGSSVVPGSTRGSSVLGECGLAQERILRCSGPDQVVETRRLELLTLSLQRRCSAN
jgi:hypothetical protein